jgi:phospho-N-acetylmuramoyl-pentapeptide-transferase
MLISPFLIKFLVRNKLWKKKSVTKTIDGREATISSALHNDEVKQTPRMGGIAVWTSVLLTSFIFWILGRYAWGAPELDFVSRSQTWLPLATLIAGSLIGLMDDFAVTGKLGSYIGGGISLRLRILLVAIIGFLTSSWFYYKLEMSAIVFPFFGEINLGILFIPLFIIVMIALFSGGIIDGIDGLSGSTMSSIFGAYGIIALLNNQIDIATFCFVVVGALLAFLWWNAPPAQYYMSETGMLGLTTSLTVVAYLTNAVPLLAIIALPLIVTSLSSIIQIASKKIRNGKKVFIVAPVHNHFQALGMAGHTVTIRYWIVSLMCALTGIIVHIIS